MLPTVSQRRAQGTPVQGSDSSPVRTSVSEVWSTSNFKLLHLEKMTHSGRMLRFTVSLSRVWPLYRSDTELASRINVM